MKDSYRLQTADEACISLGFIKRAKSLDAIAEAAADHGASHYVVVSDTGGVEYQTTSSAVGTRLAPGVTIANGSSTTRANKLHEYTAEAFSCPE